VAEDVLGKIAAYVECLGARNIAGANAVQTDLANSHWSQHKEWIKGLKTLLQLAKNM
jgi:hypothetical protein